MKIESDAILDWLTAERKLLRKELAEAHWYGWKGRITELEGSLSEVNKALKALEEYRGETEK